MTNAKLTRRALLSSVLALVLCFTMLLGTTFAWFTDEAVSGGNKIVAGNLDVQLLLGTGDGVAENYEDISDDSAPIFGINADESLRTANDNNADTLWEPGKTQVAYLAIKNNGNLDLKYQVALNVVNPTDGKNLYEAMQYAITPGAMKSDDVTAWDSTKANDVVLGTQDVSINAEDGTALVLKKGETHYFALSIHMDENADNAYKNGKVEFDLTVLAAQLNSELDSFGKDYDEDATYGYTAEVKALQALLKAAKAGDTVEFALTQDALATESIVVPEGVKLVLDGNGHTLTMDLATGNGFYAKYAEGLTIKNLTITGSVARAAIFTLGAREIVDGKMVEHLSDVVLENVTVDMDEIDTVNEKYCPVYFNGMGNATLNNCTFIGAAVETDDYLNGAHVFAGAEMKVEVNGGNVGVVFINANHNSPESIYASGITVNSGTVEKLILESDWLDDKTGTATYTNNGGTVNEIVMVVDTGAEMASAIAKGYSVALHKDISYDGVIAPASGTSFNVYGYNYTVNASIYTVGGGNFVFNDMTWGGTASYAFYNQGGNVTMNNVTVEKDGDYVLLLFGGGVVELNDCKVTGTAPSKTSIWFGDGRTVTINGGTYSSMIINASKGAGIVSAGTLTLNDTSVERVRVGAVEDAGVVTRANVINNNSTVDVMDYEK